MPTPCLRAVRRASLPLLALVLAGCALFRVEEPLPPVPPQVPASEMPRAAPVVTPQLATVPGPRPPRAPPPRDVVILFRETSAADAEVAAQIAKLLPADRYRVAVTPLAADRSATITPTANGRPHAVAVAVGREAADAARAQLAGSPLVFCEVFNYQELLAAGGAIWGVHSVPPLALQLRGWSTIDPQRRRIGLIVSDAQASLVDEAIAAANGTVEIKAEVSSSDRETLYLFKRLVPQIDGLWLSSDNRILSPAVLRELLGYAIAHDVGVLVPNDALLAWGALMSARSTPTDVAQRVRGVVERVAAGATAGLPAMTPLGEIALRVNPSVARDLGLVTGPETVVVVRESD